MYPTMVYPKTDKSLAEKASDLIINSYIEHNNMCDIPTDWKKMSFLKEQLARDIESACSNMRDMPANWNKKCIGNKNGNKNGYKFW